MALAPGITLGPYEILSRLGAGGMGEVYRARDTRLGRTVAIKVLAAEATASPEARRWLQHEARAISSLNHSHICTLFDVGLQDGIDFLVMEYLEGETLADRLERGAIPIEELLKIATQIAGALESAHRRSLTHRDLKPANIMLTKTGAKLLDFGIARLVRSDPTSSDLPTLTVTVPLDGTIVCTVPYAAPEVLAGRPADARSDLWALGAVIYEMTTGKRAFDKGSTQSSIAAILNLEPVPIVELSPDVPPGLVRIVGQCLAKDPDERWQTAGDLRRELEWMAESRGSVHGLAPVRLRATHRWMWSAALLLVAAASVGITMALRPARPAPELVRFEIAEAGTSTTAVSSDVAVSPDGRHVTYVGADSKGKSGLWVRRLSDLTQQFLAGTGDATYPFWSPDSRQIAFFAEGKLKRVFANGGEVSVVCDAPDARGGSWGSGGVIVFAPKLLANLLQVPAAGGTARPANTRDSTERGEQRFPCFLPDGRHFLYASSGNRILVGALDSPKRTFLLKTNRTPVYAAPGYLVYAQDGCLVAQRFNARNLRLSGQPVRLSEGEPPSRNTGDRVASASGSGVLVFPTVVDDVSQLAWSDVHDEVLGTQPLPAGPFLSLRLSPDGQRVALTGGSASRGIWIWIYDLTRSTAERLTFGEERDRSPLWSPEGDRILFQSTRAGTAGLYLRRADASGKDTLLLPGAGHWMDPYCWSPDGNFVAFGRISPATGYDIWTMPMRGDDHTPSPFLNSPANEKYGDIAPDGKWLAYESNESGRFEIFVQSFPRAGTKYQVTSTGGRGPRWSRDGRELFYNASSGALLSVLVDGSQGLRFGTPVPPVKRGPPSNALDTPAGPRFLSIRVLGSGDRRTLTVMQNWTAVTHQGR